MPKPPATQQRPARPIDLFKAQLKAALPTVARMLPAHVKPDEFEARVITAVANKPELLECDAHSLLKAVAEAAEIGLSLNPHLGEAWILKVWNKRNNHYEAQLRPGFIGLMKLARHSGDIAQIVSNIRYANDRWKMVQVPPELRHEPADGDRGDILGAYCWWKLKDGTEQFEYIPEEDLQKIKQRSSSKNKEGEVVGPWITDPDEMRRKTAIRRARKYMPQSPNMDKFHAAVARENEMDFEESVDGEFTDVTEDAPPKPASEAGKAQADSLADRVSGPARIEVPDGFDGPDYPAWQNAVKEAMAKLTLTPTGKKAWFAAHDDILKAAPKDIADAVRALA